jgi:hypothetical protein
MVPPAGKEKMETGLAFYEIDSTKAHPGGAR